MIDAWRLHIIENGGWAANYKSCERSGADRQTDDSPWSVMAIEHRFIGNSYSTLELE
mgnify:CR=1 FL=1